MERKTETPASRDSSDLLTDPDVIARVESQNALQQFDYAIALVESHTKERKPFRLTVDLICELNRLATAGIKANAGKLRKISVGIRGSRHQPPPANAVLPFLEEMCEYVNQNWDKSPIHLAAYVMWRSNWIHPFEDGNGRTSRMLSYLILCIHLGFVLPGTHTIPDQIAANKPAYYPPLEDADAAYDKGVIDLRSLEKYLSDRLAEQLVDVHEQAVGVSGVNGP